MRRALSTIVSSVDRVPRAVKALNREVDLARRCLADGTNTSLRKLLTIIRKEPSTNEATSRIAACGAALALKLKRVDDAVWCLERVTHSPAIMRRSLLVSLHIQKNEIHQALDEVEGVLNEEDTCFNSINSHISNEALDQLHSAIQSQENSQNEMRRFRRIQKALTQYRRRSDATIDEILASTIATEPIICDRSSSEPVELTEKIIEQTPAFLFEEQETVKPRDP